MQIRKNKGEDEGHEGLEGGGGQPWWGLMKSFSGQNEKPKGMGTLKSNTDC